jgi:hypothetical protein
MALLPESVSSLRIFVFLNCSWEPLEILGSGLSCPPRIEGSQANPNGVAFLAWFIPRAVPVVEAGC